MHLLDSFGLGFKFPTEETILDSPIHGISGDSSQQISGDSDLILIPSPSYHIGTQDSSSFFLKGLDDSLNTLGSILFFQDDLIVSIIFDKMKYRF